MRRHEDMKKGDLGDMTPSRGEAEEDRDTMKCVICGQGEMRPGTATVVLDHEGHAVIVKQVPAQVCENCGEEYVDEAADAAALDGAERAVRDGAEVVIREYAAA